MFGLFESKKAKFSQLGITTDWHCHILPAVDDGVKNFAQAEEILRDMRANGITTVVHTPHINPEIYHDNTEDYLRSAFERYLDVLPADCHEGMELRLAGEYMVVNGFENRKMNELLQIEPGKVLIEMSYMYPSHTIEQSVFNISMAGLTPVIAHPERYIYYADRLSEIERLHDMGAEFQLNLLSLCGCYGSGSMRILDYISSNGWYSYVGSDTHTSAHFRHIADMKFNAKYLPSLKTE